MRSQSPTAWTGNAVLRARTQVAGWLPAPCGRCGEEVTITEPWVVGHVVARWRRPDLTFEPSN